MWAVTPMTTAAPKPSPPPPARDRYVTQWSTTRRRWVIVDREMRDVCTLMDADGIERVLVFMTGAVALAHLHRCYLAWGDRPKIGRPHPAPLPPER